jgi:hypothetical protein
MEEEEGNGRTKKPNRREGPKVLKKVLVFRRRLGKRRLPYARDEGEDRELDAM